MINEPIILATLSTSNTTMSPFSTCILSTETKFKCSPACTLYPKALAGATSITSTFTIKDSEIQETVQKGDLEFHIESNKQTFSGDDQIKVSASVKNVGQEDVIHHGSSSCDREVYISIQKNGESQDFVGEGDKERWACTTDWEKFELVPGEIMRAQATFDLLLGDFENDMNERPESGQYVIVARYGDETIKLPITIE